jgi:hypothetical protein
MSLTLSSHLVNNGVDESPPSRALQNGSSSTASSLNPRDLFVDLEGANVGFHHWHPVSVVEKGGKLSGQADLGGVWEWTSTILEKQEGFEPMELYPAYTGRFSMPLEAACLTLISGLLRWKTQHHAWWILGNASSSGGTEDVVRFPVTFMFGRINANQWQCQLVPAQLSVRVGRSSHCE